MANRTTAKQQSLRLLPALPPTCSKTLKYLAHASTGAVRGPAARAARRPKAGARAMAWLAGKRTSVLAMAAARPRGQPKSVQMGFARAI